MSKGEQKKKRKKFKKKEPIDSEPSSHDAKLCYLGDGGKPFPNKRQLHTSASFEAGVARFFGNVKQNRGFLPLTRSLLPKNK